jgi:hypothetical protein
MTNELGIEHDPRKPLAPVVVTPPLPDPVLRHAEQSRQLEKRREWQERKRRGFVSEDETPPPAPSLWQQVEVPVLGGAATVLLVGLPVQAIAALVGHLFGFRIGLFGWWVGMVAGFLVALGRYEWQEHARSRDAQRVADSRREITHPGDRAELLDALQRATAVTQLWPELPLDLGPAEPPLHQLLSDLSGELIERRRFTQTLGALRESAMELPSGCPTSQDVAERIKHVEIRRRVYAARVDELLKRVRELDERCDRLHQELQAITRAREANRRADEVLGGVLVAKRVSESDLGVDPQRIEDVLSAYSKLNVPLVMAAPTEPI